MMDDLVAYGIYPNSKQGDITLKNVRDMVAQMDKYTMRYPKRRGMYDMDWPSLPPDFKPKEKKKEQHTMAFQMSYQKEELSGALPVPAGWYTLQVKNFRPKASKDGESVSLNAELAIINNAEYDGRRIFAGLNSKAGFIIFDFVHACGLPMEEVQNEFAGTEKANLTLPGFFEGSDTHPDDPSQWKYQGPLLNKAMEVELAETEYQGKKRNEVRQYKCAVPGCTEKHSTNLIKN